MKTQTTMKQKFFEERVDKGSETARLRLENGSRTARKRTLFALITLLLMLSIGQMWGADLTIIGYSGGTTTGTVKIHNNTDSKTAICKFANSWSTGTNFYSITTVGGFKSGDVVNFSGAINSGKTDKYAKIAIYAADKSTKLYTSINNVIDGNNSASDPTAESYTLTSDQDSLLFARDGNTALYLLTLTVTRSSGGGSEPEEDTTAPTLASSVPANSATGVATSGTIVLTFSEAIASVDGSKFTLSGATKGTIAVDDSDSKKVNVPYSGAANASTVTLSVAASAVADAAGNTSAVLSDIHFTTAAAKGTIDDLVEIGSDFTFTPTVALEDKTLYAGNKIISLGGNGYNNGVQIKTNRQLAFKVAAGAKIIATFIEKSERTMQIGTESAGTDLANSATSPVAATRATAGIVYISASNDLYLTKLEIQYLHTVTYALNGGTGTTPTQASQYAGETFTVHNGVTGVTAPAGKEFAKWKDQDNTDVAAGATYTMPAKDVTLTAQWVTPPTRYTVSFNLQGHGSSIASQSIIEGEKVAKPADPSADGWLFEGWYKESACTNAWDFANDAVTKATELFAKWTEYDPCAYLAVDLTADAALHVGSELALTTSSFGGSVHVAGMKSTDDKPSIQYNGYGLYLSGGGADSLRVTIGHQLQEGSKITLYLRCAGNEKTRGLNLLTNAGAEIAALGWGEEGVANAEASFTYEVPENSPLIGEKSFRLQRNNTIYLKYVSVEKCAPQDFTVTYKDGETTLGTEYVFENEHPTAADVSTRKNGYAFDGWAETAGGAVVNLNSITITADKTLYAQYTARDCSSAGTKFKFQLKTDLTSGNMFATAPLATTALTTENFLAELVGGELDASNTNSNNNRIIINDQKAIGFANGDGGKLTLKLDCPLQENDEIRYINYAKSDNSITLSDGTNSTVLNGNGKEEMQTFVVTADWETTGSYELTMVRAGGTAKLTYFEIYRRPELASVTLEDMNLKKGKTGTPVVTLYPADASVSSQVWEITACTATGTTIDAATGLITAGETTGDITVKVTVNGDKEATCTVKVVAGFDVPRPVTETTTWNWATLAVAAGDGPTINNPDTVLANYLSGEEWEMLAGNAGGRPYRHNSNYMCYQGTSLYFKAAVPGILTVNAGYTSSDKVCNVSVNGHVIGETPASHANLNKIVVAPGDVYITATSMRIYSMKFDTDLSAYELTDNVLDGYSRELQPGVLSTTCLPNSGVIAGASVFEIAYMDYEADGVTPYKIYFDEVVNGEMEAGVPYIVLANEGSTLMNVFYTDNANESAKSKNGLVGYMGEKTSLAANDYFIYNNMFYYVSAADAASGRIKISNNRAYLNLAEIPGYSTSVPAPGRRRMAMGNGDAPKVPTAVDTMQADKVRCTKVLIDGRFFILRGEKMYDATGRLVK